MLLELFRSHKRWLMFIAMILVIPSFVVTGIYSYNRMISDDGAIAKVDDTSITPQDFDQAKRRQLDMLRNSMGESFRADMLDNPEGRAAILERIMNDRSLLGEMNQGHVLVGEATAIEMVKTFPAFQKEGKFNRELYENYLASAGYTDEYFVQLMRGDIGRQLVTSGITRTSLVPDTVAKNVHRLLSERRTLAVASIPTADYLKKVTVTEDEAKRHWSENQKAYERADEIDVQYVVLTPELFGNVTPSEEEVRTFYEQNPGRFRAAEQRRASHILIDLSQGREKAKAKAEEILAQVKADPTKFAELAKANSADTGSAEEGGDLGFFGRGMMVPPFEEAVFKAKEGDIVGPVETDFGFHIIRVTGVHAEGVRPFEEVKDEIVQLYRQQESHKRFAAEADQFTNMVYEQSDSLESVITKYGLKPVVVKNVSAEGPADPEVRALLNQHVVESLFSDECLREKRNTQALEVSPNKLVAARVLAYHPRHVMPFEEVRTNVMQMLTRKKAAEMAHEEGRAMLASLKTGAKSKVTFAEPKKVSRMQPAGLPFELINTALRVDAKTLPTYVGVATDEGFTLARVSDSEVKEPTEAELKSARREVAQMFGQAEQLLYFQGLRDKHGAVILNKDYKPGATETK